MTTQQLIIFSDSNRAIRATWSLEAVQDLNSQYNIDAAAILADMMIAELTAEIDNEILNDVVNVRARDLYFSEEAHADILAWTGGGVLGHGPVRTKTIEKINWKEEGF